MLRYWVTPNVAGGSIPEDEDDYRDLQRLGIKVIISLAEDWEYEYYTGMTLDYVSELVKALGMKLVRKPVPDGHAPDVEELARLAESILVYEQRGEKVLVHCVGGIGRTPTVLAAFLMLSRGLDLYDALRVIQRVNPEISLTESQFEALEKLSRAIRARTQTRTY